MQERCKIGVVIGNANSPHAINIMKGIDQASRECDVQLMYFMNVSSPYTAQLYPPDTSIGWDYQKSAIYDYARYVKADVLIMTYGMMSIFMKSDYGKQYLEYFRNVPCVLIKCVTMGIIISLFWQDRLEIQMPASEKEHF